jgi:cytochrome d ubiquinol oxidase subunit II
MSLDYESLRCIAWGLLWLMIIHFALTGGYDLGVAILLPFLAPTDKERSQLIQTLGLTNNGYQIGFIFIGLMLFSVWPMVYTVLLSGLSYLLLLSVIALLLRPFAVYYRAFLLQESSRIYWDKSLWISGFLPLFMLGLTLGNLLKGMPFHLDSDMRLLYYSNFWGLLNPFALLTAITTLGLFVMGGAIYLQCHTHGEIALRAQKKVILAAIITAIGFILAGLWLMRLEGYHIDSGSLPNGESNPLAKFVKRGEGLWLDNYEHIPALIAVPSIALISCIVTVYLSINKLNGIMISHAICIISMLSTVALSLFPFMLPSTLSLNSSLTLWDSSASYQTLQITLWIMWLFLPLSWLYLRWVIKLVVTHLTY